MAFPQVNWVIFAELNNCQGIRTDYYDRVLISINRMQDAQLLLQRLLACSRGRQKASQRTEVLNLLALLAFKNNHVRQALKYIERIVG
jgi:hypothetical protein